MTFARTCELGLKDFRSELRSMNERMDRIEHKQDALDTDIRSRHDHLLALLEAGVFGSVR